MKAGQPFTVTRTGHQIGELTPPRPRRRFTSRDVFKAMSRSAPSVSLDAFRANQNHTAEQGTHNPYEQRRAPRPTEPEAKEYEG